MVSIRAPIAATFGSNAGFGIGHLQLSSLRTTPLGALIPLERAFGALGCGARGMCGPLALPGPGAVLSRVAAICVGGYAPSTTLDLGRGAPDDLFSRILNPQRRSAVRMERLLRNDPSARAAFEDGVGGRIVGFGKSDGKIRIQPHAPRVLAFAPAPQFAPAVALLGMHRHIAGSEVLGARAWHGMLLGPVARLVDSMGLGAGSGGAGIWAPGGGPKAPSGPGGAAQHQTQVASVLNDSSLTVEDKVVLMLMLITQNMDKKIEDQLQEIQKLQQQQGRGGKKGGKGGGKKGGGGGASKSIDVESMKVKRMIDKRGQMFEILKNIIDRYNETAKSVIQSISR